MKEVEAMLRQRFGIADEASKTFRGRMQNMQRLGFPSGVNTGRGKRVDYGWWEVLQLALAFDLIDAGLPQEAAARIVSSDLDGVLYGVSAFALVIRESENVDHLITSGEVPAGAGTYLFCAANSLRQLGSSPEDYQPYLGYIGEDEMAPLDNELRHELLKGSRVVLDLGSVLLFALRYTAVDLEKGIEPTLASFQSWLDELER